MATIKVKVTKRDIEEARAEREDLSVGYDVCKQCPIGRALRRHPGFEKGGMGYTVAFLNADNASAGSFPVPAEATRFVYAFDGREPVQPFAFDLTIPDNFYK